MDFNVLSKGNLEKLDVELAQQKADKKAALKEAIEGPIKGVEKAPKAVRKAISEDVEPKAKAITAKDVKALHKAVDDAEAKKQIPKRMAIYQKVVAYKTKFPECLRGQPNPDRAIEQYAEINNYFSSIGSESLARITFVEGFALFEKFAYEAGLLNHLRVRPGFSPVLADVIANNPKLFEPELTQFQVEMGGFKVHWIPRLVAKVHSAWTEWSNASAPSS